jgi:Amylo-alpha-1,6-glucosidase
MRAVHVLTLVFSLNALGADLAPVRDFSVPPGELFISVPCVPATPWSVPGERGAILGRQGGIFEAWLWPVKILSDFRISAELQDYPVPIDVNALAAQIQVTPAETVIIYSHAAFTIRQHAFAARGKQRAAIGAAVYFEIQSARPLELTFSFTPDMLRMWPAPNFGRPDGEWIKQGSGGFYVLHTDNPEFSGLVAMPHTRPGIMPPYQEHPQRYPLQLRLSYDPKRDAGQVFPLVMGMVHGKDYTAQVESIDSSVPEVYDATQKYYSHFFDRRTVVDSPDARVNEAARWAEIALDQMQVGYHDEIGLVAGYYMSADSARPGFAWFFGRDTLFSVYAINSYGDFALSRTALDFLIRRQREDGKMMHEFSQSADSTDWKSTPYFYASADATPLFIMTLRDYVEASNDTEYLNTNWNAVKKAYSFMQAHESPQGIYDNREGTGWVESWPPTMPRQEIYLAVLDQQSMNALGQLADIMGDRNLSTSARDKAKRIEETVESTYFESANQFYAFSRNEDGSLDHTASIYPAVAWWDGTLALRHPGPMMSRWASAEFSTDWGTRDISVNTPFYDPISYHQGSVWPLFTGWASIAEYRAGRSVSAYAHLMANLNMTWSQDLGSVTELLSGDFFAPLGRSTAHQMWSSAMVLTPMLRGLFGLCWMAPDKTLQVAPRLPAGWNDARLKNVHLGNAVFDLTFTRDGSRMKVIAQSATPETLCLTTAGTQEAPCRSAPSTSHTVSVALPAVEIGIPTSLPSPGSVTSQMKVLDEEYAANRATFTLAGRGGSEYDVTVRANVPGVRLEGGSIDHERVHIRFPDGTGYQTKKLTFLWTGDAN